YKREEIIRRILRLERPKELQCLVKPPLAAKENYQYDLGIDAGLAISSCRCPQVVQTFLLASAKPDHTRSDLHSPGKTANYVIVGTDDQLGVQVVGIEFQHFFMIVTCPDGVAEC